MDKQLLKAMAKQAWYYILSYFTHYLWPIIKDALEKTKNYFLETLWDSVKDELKLRVKATVEYAEYFFDSYTYKEKEKIVIDALFRNAEFPLVLRPFKPLLKVILKNKLHSLIEKYLKKLSTKF